MQRREIIQLFAASAASLWAKQQLPASALMLAAAPASATGKASIPIAPVPQDNPLPETLLPLFPLPVVLFPRAILPLHIFEERYKEMIQDCLQNHREFGVLLIQAQSLENVGCTASISEVVRRYPDGQMDILVRGQRRFEISLLNQEKSYLRGKPQFLEDDETEPPAEELRRQAIQLNGRLMELLGSRDPSLKEPAPPVSEAQVSFQIMAGLPASLGWRQGLLELRSERERLVRVIGYLQQLIAYWERAPERRAPDHRPPPGTV